MYIICIIARAGAQSQPRFRTAYGSTAVEGVGAGARNRAGRVSISVVSVQSDFRLTTTSHTRYTCQSTLLISEF